MKAKSKVSDPLGMDASITRRDFIGSTLVDHRSSILEAQRAVGQLLDQVLTT